MKRKYYNWRSDLRIIISFLAGVAAFIFTLKGVNWAILGITRGASQDLRVVLNVVLWCSFGLLGILVAVGIARLVGILVALVMGSKDY